MSTAAHSTLRGIRADGIRDLARRALAQGFDIGLSGSGHLRLVPPDGGRPVYMSASSTAGDWHELKRARANLIRVGFDPYFDARARRRAARESIVETVADDMMRPGPLKPISREKPMNAAPPPNPHGRSGVEHARYKDGASVFVTDDVVTIAGQQVRLRRQANGRLAAWTPPEAPIGERKSWSASPTANRGHTRRTPEDQRRAIAEKVVEWVAAGRPAAKPVEHYQQAKSGAKEQTSVPTNGHVDAPDREDVATEAALLATGHHRAQPKPTTVAAALATPTPIRPSAGAADEPQEDAAVRWLTVRVEEAEYPLARALAELVDSVVPAIAALEKSGRKAAADLLVESVEMSPAERELAALWADIHGKPRLEHGRRLDDDDD